MATVKGLTVEQKHQAYNALFEANYNVEAPEYTLLTETDETLLEEYDNFKADMGLLDPNYHLRPGATARKAFDAEEEENARTPLSDLKSDIKGSTAENISIANVQLFHAALALEGATVTEAFKFDDVITPEELKFAQDTIGSDNPEATKYFTHAADAEVAAAKLAEQAAAKAEAEAKAAEAAAELEARKAALEEAKLEGAKVAAEVEALGAKFGLDAYINSDAYTGKYDVSTMQVSLDGDQLGVGGEEAFHGMLNQALRSEEKIYTNDAGEPVTFAEKYIGDGEGQFKTKHELRDAALEGYDKDTPRDADYSIGITDFGKQLISENTQVLGLEKAVTAKTQIVLAERMEAVVPEKAVEVAQEIDESALDTTVQVYGSMHDDVEGFREGIEVSERADELVAEGDVQGAAELVESYTAKAVMAAEAEQIEFIQGRLDRNPDRYADIESLEGLNAQEIVAKINDPEQIWEIEMEARMAGDMRVHQELYSGTMRRLTGNHREASAAHDQTLQSGVESTLGTAAPAEAERSIKTDDAPEVEEAPATPDTLSPEQAAEYASAQDNDASDCGWNPICGLKKMWEGDEAPAATEQQLAATVERTVTPGPGLGG